MKEYRHGRPLKTRTISLFFVAAILPFICLCLAYGESSAVRDIRNQYNTIKKEIGSRFLYHDRLEVNPADSPWPSLGNYRAVYDIYYRLKEINGEMPRDKCVLLIRVHEEAAVHEIAKEYLFNPNGELIFYYDSDEKERRLYFSEGNLVAYAADDILYEKDADSHIDKRTVAGIMKRAYTLASFFEALY
jgi:hypothetical protein